jgi:hypothetical protein
MVWMPGARSGRRRSDSGADRRARQGFNFFRFSKTRSNCKFEREAFVFSKKSQILHETRMEYCAQLYQFWLPQIPNVKNVKNPGTDSIFKSSMNFKGDQTFREKIDKFSKIISGLDIQKNEFS